MKNDPHCTTGGYVRGSLLFALLLSAMVATLVVGFGVAANR